MCHPETGSKVVNVIVIFQLLYICLACHGRPVQHIQNASASEAPVELSSPVPGAERLHLYLPHLEGRTIGCVVNHSSLVAGVHLIDTLSRSGISIRTVFAPEHGFRGDADAGAHISDGKDPATGIPVISLYGARRKPDTADLEGIDLMLFDIQDVGVRFYTYISTLHYVMEACAEHGIPLIVLDRPNPNGYYVDGPVLDPAYRSFVGMHPIPVVYGMTIGELALMINGEGWLADGLQCVLTVIPCSNYDHTMTCELPVPPSPNLPNLRSILLYPSLCYFEGTEVSVGRGTTKQFQALGHPLPLGGGDTFTPVPMPGATDPPHKGKLLYGTDLSVLDIDTIFTWRRINLEWLISYHNRLAPERRFFLANTSFFDRLVGSSELRRQLAAGSSEADIRASWKPQIDAFLERRKLYLLYDDFE